MKILMHVCCAPCFSYPSRAMKNEHELTGFWYNPNIHPSMEYKRRLETLKQFEQVEKLKIIYNEDYPFETWLETALTLNKKQDVLRCRYCYADRLEKTAKYAKDHGFDAFSTTMLYSPYQKHELVKEISEKLAKKYDITFYYEDFRDHYKEGQEIAKNLGLYRQKYCGCIFSEISKFERH